MSVPLHPDMKKITTFAIFIAIALSAPAQETRKLGIAEMFELIEHNNKDLKAGKTGVEAAQEGILAARSQRLPDINAEANVSYIGNALLTDRNFSDVHGLKSPHFGNQILLDIRQTLYAGGAINAGIRLADLGAEQSGLGVEQLRQNRRMIALGQYLELEKATNREKVLESNIALTNKLIDNIKERYAQGVALKNDVTRYELQLQTLNLNLTKVRNNRSIINHQLCNTLGLVPGTIIDPTDDAAKHLFAKDGEAHWQTSASANSPQLKMAAISEQIAHQQFKLSQSEMLPKVAFVAQNNFNGPITFELPPVDKNLNTWFIGVGVQYSLSSLFKSNKRVAQAKFRERQAREQRAAAAEQVNNNVQEAYTYYLQSYNELETQQKNVELARQNYDVINNRYLNQLALVTDMVDASNTKLDAELSEVDARINIAYAYYKMKYVAGEL